MDIQAVVMPEIIGSQVEHPRSERLPAPTMRAPAPPDTSTAARMQVAIDRANGSMPHDLDFSSDPGTKRTVMRIVDRETGQVIRQFPSAGALAIAQDIDRQRDRMLQLIA